MPDSYGLTLGCIYRPPHLNIGVFNQYICDVLTLNRCLTIKKCITAGDFNMDLLRFDLSPGVMQFCNLFLSLGLKLIVTEPTHWQAASCFKRGLLDHTWTNMNGRIQSFVIDVQLSDHLPVASFFDVYVHDDIKFKIFRNITQKCIDNLFANKRDLFANFEHTLTDVHVGALSLHNFLVTAADRFFPICKKQVSLKGLSKPWISKRILTCITDKHKLFCMVKNGTLSYSVFKIFSSILKHLISK
jgi:hypothetical protein